MRRTLAGIAVLIVGATAAPVLAGVNGAWSGRFISPEEVGNIPTSAYPTAKLVVGAASLTAQFSGRTQAAHDPETAMSTCSMQFRFRSALSSDGWRVYEQVGKVVLGGSVSGGMPDLSGCQGNDPSGASHVVVRLRPAGDKLKAEFGLRFGQKGPEFGPGSLRGYLHH